MSLENPGSLVEFAQRNEIEVGLAVGAYALELDRYREDLAQALGISLSELHNLPQRTICPENDQ